MKYYPWQKNQWQRLLQAYQKNKLSHAYLLSGVSGLGKTDFANAFAQFLLCESLDKKESACGQCRSCQLLQAQSHPDLISITPEEKGHSIKIDAVRALTQKTSHTAHRGRYQVVVITPADAMPVAAANALLKTLEEPTGPVVMLLVCDQVDRLPATILSRCQRIQFSGDHHTETMQWLRNHVKTDQDLSVLLKMANGSPLKVKAFVDNNYLTLRDQLLKHLFMVAKHQESAIGPVPQWIKCDRELFFHALLTLCVDFSRVQMNVNESFLMNADTLSRLQKVAVCISPFALQQFMTILMQKKKLLATGINLNLQLLLEDLLIQWENLTC